MLLEETIDQSFFAENLIIRQQTFADFHSTNCVPRLFQNHLPQQERKSIVKEIDIMLIEDIVAIYDNYGFETQVLVASIRHPQHVVEAARLGAHVGTMPQKVVRQLFKHPLTDIGLAKFMEDWKKVPSA